MIPQSFSKKISKRHQRNLHTWSYGNGEWRVRQCHTTICRLEGHIKLGFYLYARCSYR